MKRLCNILLFLTLYILLCSKGCDSAVETDEEKNNIRTENIEDSIRTEFQSGSLSPGSLKAFETMAKQKVADFADYLQILRDTSVADAFRKKTQEMILGLFVNGSSLLHFSGPGNIQQDFPVSNFITDVAILSYIPSNLNFDSIKTIQPLHKVSDTLYSGILHFPLTLAGRKAERPSAGKPSSCTVDVVVLPHNKIFGKDTLKVWTVFLGK
jgi:hypothetical protein